MKRLALASMFALFALISAGCSNGPIDYRDDFVPVNGRNIFVEMPHVTNCHEDLDKEALEALIKAAAEEKLKSHNFTIVADAASADVVMRAEVWEFNLGSQTARIMNVGGRASHDTTMMIQPGGGPANEGHREAEVSAGSFSRYKGAEQYRRALVDAIAQMHLWVAQDYTH